jgi:hypothetical protein
MVAFFNCKERILHGAAMSKINTITNLSILLLLLGTPCCTYTFDITKNTLINPYQRTQYISGEEWGIFFVVDDDQLKEFIGNYKEMKDTDPSISAENSPVKEVNYTFQKYQYLIFYMLSDTPQKPIGDKYKFSITDAKGNPVKITDTFFFITRDNPDDKKKFEYKWMFQFEKPLTKELFPKELTPFLFTVSSGTYSSAKIEISY